MKRLLVLLLVLGGCTKKKNPAPPPKPPPVEEKKSKRAPGEADRIEVRLVVVSFKGCFPDAKSYFTREQAEEKAKEMYEAAKQPNADFNLLADDCEPFFQRWAQGTLGVTNYEVQPQGHDTSRQRLAMVLGSAVAESAFKLGVAEVVLVPYDTRQCRYGWVILKRAQ